MDAGGAAIRGPTLAARGKFRQAFLNDSKAREVTCVAMYETVISNLCGTKNDAITPPDRSIIFLQETLKHGKNVIHVRHRQAPSVFDHAPILKIYVAHPPHSNDLLRDAFRIFPNLDSAQAFMALRDLDHSNANCELDDRNAACREINATPLSKRGALDSRGLRIRVSRCRLPTRPRTSMTVEVRDRLPHFMPARSHRHIRPPGISDKR